MAREELADPCQTRIDLAANSKQPADILNQTRNREPRNRPRRPNSQASMAQEEPPARETLIWSSTPIGMYSSLSPPDAMGRPAADTSMDSGVEWGSLRLLAGVVESARRTEKKRGASRFCVGWLGG